MYIKSLAAARAIGWFDVVIKNVKTQDLVSFWLSALLCMVLASSRALHGGASNTPDTSSITK